MSRKLDYFIDVNICCDEASEADELVELIDKNENFILDWDLQGVDDDGSPIDGAIISVQLQDKEGFNKFMEVLKLNNFGV